MSMTSMILLTLSHYFHLLQRRSTRTQSWQMVAGLTSARLHPACRLKDAPAQALYERAGFAEVQKDNVLVLLLGQDRRFLMRKRLTPGLTPGSA